MPIANIGIAAPSPKAPLTPWKYEIRDLRDDDVKIEVHYCGVCHSDIHTVHDDWFPGIYPLVPGHEFTGIVAEIGSNVTKMKVGDRVGIGCMVGSCRECKQCLKGQEQYCRKGLIGTYSARMPDGEITYGGYGKWVVAQQHFVIRIPDSLPLDLAAPLLCAGITTYSPCNFNNMQRGGLKVGVIGLGGLGHMAVQWAKAMGNEVIVFTRSLNKKEDALKLGAADVVLSTDQEAMARHSRTLDYIIDTVCAEKPMNDYVALLDSDGTLITVGAPPFSEPVTVNPFSLILGRRTIQGSCIGGIAETQEMVNFAAEHGVKPWIEIIKGDYINEAYDRVIKSDVKFRFVIDVRATHEGQL
eukprot:Gregarina_sp_Poly_1__72@NODE_1015_length_5360_cov_819_728887_g708_i0_p2_GENE_NODE_1015_length_5360_cov_819_728887_g708_i0NODE_1015_length_5360_cov_819_728887_g708_i0_p2_ORF_typecomplete_len356_score38_52ADH_N/PF08240_12/1_3e31ADH_zinc_N/PF00107_26/8_9e23Glu_dehyd_C/PF16912_5/1_8e11AlaDh_PNT_C/PF01262_21/3_8e082Hacid_dh_C/PF02826_19/3_1e06ADH_zinc_N_2/PF13602_6/7_3e05NAD_binding_2/PF03446_15/0_00048Shikimate_DH/PF01488_20/0_012AdoHcyase_NAD/PF00670_21/0_033NAD_binding_10/PF13460_6/0_049GFO_IDH_Mo